MSGEHVREHWPCAAATPDILQLGEDLEAIHWEDGTTTLSIGRDALTTLSLDEVQKLAEFLSKRRSIEEKAINQLIVGASGVDLDTAARLGYPTE